jgi:hypothetical protein
VNEDEVVEKERLGPPLGTVEFWDCRVSFRRQDGTDDVWSVTSGPLGTFATRLIEAGALRQVQAGRAKRDASFDESSRRRTRGWPRVRIDSDFVVALRGRGNWLELAYLFGDGAAFGGASSGLPTSRRASLRERVGLWLSGARGNPVQVFRRDDPAHAQDTAAR